MCNLEASTKADIREIDDNLQLLPTRPDSLDFVNIPDETHKQISEFMHDSNAAHIGPPESPGQNRAAFGAASAPSVGSPQPGKSHDECNRHRFGPTPYEAHVKAEHVPSWDVRAAAPHDYRGPSPSPPPPPFRPQPHQQPQHEPHAAPGYGQQRFERDGFGQYGSSQPRKACKTLSPASMCLSDHSTVTNAYRNPTHLNT